MFVVYEEVDTVFGMDDEKVVSFETEKEAQDYIAQFEASELEEYGEVFTCYWYDEEEDF